METIGEMRSKVNSQIQILQNILREIDVCEDLHLRTIDREFMETDFLLWFSDDESANKRIEKRLTELPFEQAYSYKNPEFYTKSRSQLLQHVFGDETFEWRDNPSIGSNLSIEDKYKLIKRFEYMCYYVINTREEMRFDIIVALKLINSGA